MEKQLKFVLDNSLEEISLRRVVADLWTETDTLVAVQNFPCHWIQDIKQRMENKKAALNKIKAKISKLVIPASLKERMVDVIKPIRIELDSWKTFHDSIFKSAHKGLCLYVMKRVFWTSAGTIDYRRTAELILSLDAVAVETRYSIACLYCLVDYIPVLWNELPEEFKIDYLSDVRRIQLECYWAHVMVGEESKLERTVTKPLREGFTFNQNAFETFARNGNKAATDYFLRKLTSEERKVSLLYAVDIVMWKKCTISSRSGTNFPIEKLSEMLCYLLSLLSSSQQMQVINDRPLHILMCLLVWPCQDLFLETAKFVFNFLPEKKYGYLLTSLMRSIEVSGYYFPILFRKFFEASPSEFKDYFIKFECECYSYFDKFFDAEDAETIRCVFRNVTIEHRMRLCSRYNFFEILGLLMMEGKLHLVKLCIEEISPFQKYRTCLEETYMRYLEGEDSRSSSLNKLRWKQVFKECHEDKANSSSKRGYRGKTLIKAKKLRTQ